ncbi:MFS transporter [Pantoea sp. Eser]|nr:MFS transporter [Pantoea sp. Eser]
MVFYKSVKKLGWIFAIYLIGVATSLVIAGKCSDVTESRYVCVFGCMLCFLASLYCANFTEREFSNFLMARFWKRSMLHHSSISSQEKLSHKSLTIKAYSRLNGVSCTVPIIAPSLGALLITNGWSLIFLFISFFSCVLLIFSYYFIDDKKG